MKMANIKRIAGMAAVAVFFALPLMVSCGGNSTNKKADSDGGDSPKVVFDISDSIVANRRSDTVAFGRVREGEVVVKEVAVRNTGDKPLVIVDFNKTCGCVDLEYNKKPILPGEESVVKFSFDSHGIKGWAYKTVIMQTSLNAGQYLFVVTAEVV